MFCRSFVNVWVVNEDIARKKTYVDKGQWYGRRKTAHVHFLVRLPICYFGVKHDVEVREVSDMAMTLNRDPTKKRLAAAKS